MDESELSFIRCPNCRSLVPAVASRCRMCGFILKDATSKSAPVSSESSSHTSSLRESSTEQGLDTERPSRVRQRTISVSGNVEPPIAVQPPPAPPVAVTPVAPPVRETLIEQNQIDEYDETVDEDEFEEEVESEDIESEQVIAPVGNEPARRKRRRRRRRKKQGQEQVVDAGTAAQHTVTPVIEPVKNIVADEGYAPWRTPPATSESRPGFKIARTEETLAPSMPTPSAQVSTPVEAKKVENSMRQEPKIGASAGALLGWLVSFAEDRNGVSREIREGRFFVGREQLRPTDLVINHSSVSTPQCLVVCDPVSGVTIQDLMSDRGTTLIRGSSALEKSSEQVRLENGDRIRFGEYEMLFVKLPQVR